MGIVLRDDQVDAIGRMKNGCILCGKTGSGKSLTALGYYYKLNGGIICKGEMQTVLKNPCDLVIITPAQKRDKFEWDHELMAIHMSQDPEASLYKNKVIIDSWNNIAKYTTMQNAFFIFDEQRLVGNGVWVKSFYKIAGRNKWIILSATPGDKWEDYIPVFVANGFYRNRTEFVREHIVYSYRVKFPKVDRYLSEMKLERLRQQVLVVIDYNPHTIQHHETCIVDYNRELYKWVCKERKNPFKSLRYKDVTGKKHIVPKPIENASEFCYTLRRIVNSDDSRVSKLMDIVKNKPRVIIFYNFDFELDILRGLDFGRPVYEWNGHNHDKLPNTGNWIYLVQYSAGSEAWNCTSTNYMVFYSENYSYKMMQQAAGRIDRSNTPFDDLYYWHLRSTANIDLAINKALATKKKFNQSTFYKKYS